MTAITPVTYAEYYYVVTNDLQEGDPSAIYKDKTPVSPIGSVRPTPANIVKAVCRESNLDAYLLFAQGADRGPLRARPHAGHDVSTQYRTGVELCGGADCVI